MPDDYKDIGGRESKEHFLKQLPSGLTLIFLLFQQAIDDPSHVIIMTALPVYPLANLTS